MNEITASKIGCVRWGGDISTALTVAVIVVVLRLMGVI